MRDSAPKHQTPTSRNASSQHKERAGPPGLEWEQSTYMEQGQRGQVVPSARQVFADGEFVARGVPQYVSMSKRDRLGQP